MVETGIKHAEEVREERSNGTCEGGRAWISGEFTLFELEALCAILRHEAGERAEGLPELKEWEEKMEQFNDVPAGWFFSSGSCDTSNGEILTENGRVVCHFGDGTQYYESAGCAPGDDDLRLMLAAPELLEALKCAKQHLRFAVEVISAPHHADLIDSLVAQTNQVLLHVECALIRATGE